MSEKRKTTYVPNNSRIPTREEFHRSFAGKIYQFDFGTEGNQIQRRSLASTASRIISDKRFDESCKQKSIKNGGNKNA